MYNKFLEYLMQSEPEKVLSRTGFQIRRFINPLLRKFTLISTTSKCKFILHRKEPVPKGHQFIYAPTHTFKDDTALTMKAIDDHTYILFGSIPQFYHTFDGISSWINGVIMVERTDKESRRSAMAKMEHYMGFGGNLMLYPEGVWDKSPNLLMLKLYPGIYRIAAKSKALVVPVATIYDERKNISYAIVDKAVDITQWPEKEALEHLRDIMAGLKWELMEAYCRDTRGNVLQGKTPEEYWHDHLEFLISQVEYFDRAVEDSVAFVDKSITEPADAFAHLDDLIPSRENAFLLRK